jgi:malonyl-CoA O-methyltransferase
MSERSPASRRVHLPAEATLAGYDCWAAHYDATDNPMVAATAWALRREPLAVAGQRVVELGCGTGRHAGVALAAGARDYTGVDGSAGMLAMAARDHVDPRLHWVHAGIDATGLPAAQYEHALVVLVFEHLPELAPVCREVARLLAPGGTLRLLEIHPDLVRDGINAHFHDGGVEHRFTSCRHPVATILTELAAAAIRVTACHEYRADGELLAAVPRLEKHRGRPVVLDLSARCG